MVFSGEYASAGDDGGAHKSIPVTAPLLDGLWRQALALPAPQWAQAYCPCWPALADIFG
jgi:hypothetical protein